MCGIAGIIGSQAQAVESALAAMDCAQVHRGPDDSGRSILTFGDRILGLGHRRLSIIDLSPAGHQPMIHPQTGDQIIFNGEIYNFQLLRRELESAGEKFQGHSDTEVLLYGLSRWGADWIRRLHGMFAFAFYNKRDQSLLLSRDSVGIKPLYTAQHNGFFLFASEVRTILATGLIPRHLDKQGLAGVLAYGAVQHPCTLFANVRSFPAGSYQVFHHHSNGASHKPVRYWSYPKPTSTLNQVQLSQAIDQTLTAAVRDHLISDVPLGIFLSSGLDSTIVANVASRSAARLRSFCVGFSDQPDLSEQALAAQTARLFGLNHTEINITGADAEQAAFSWLQSIDQPSMDGLNVYIISKAVRQQGITVALSGQGGDELFGGYASFADVPRLRRMMRILAPVPRALRVALARTATLTRSRAVAQKLADIVGSSGSLLDLYMHRRRAMSDGQLASLGVKADALGLTPSFHLPEALMDVHPDDADPVWSVSQLESCFYQGNILLRDGDANGMAHSLEIRFPFLDQRMLDLMMGVSGHMRLPTGAADKHLLRVTFATALRPSLLAQSKRGFGLPIRRWMLGPLRDLCEHAMLRLKSVGIFRPEGIDTVWGSFLLDPESPMWSRAFILCVLGIYIEQMKASDVR